MCWRGAKAAGAGDVMECTSSSNGQIASLRAEILITLHHCRPKRVLSCWCFELLLIRCVWGVSFLWLFILPSLLVCCFTSSGHTLVQLPMVVNVCVRAASQKRQRRVLGKSVSLMYTPCCTARCNWNWSKFQCILLIDLFERVRCIAFCTRWSGTGAPFLSSNPLPTPLATRLISAAPQRCATGYAKLLCLFCFKFECDEGEERILRRTHCAALHAGCPASLWFFCKTWVCLCKQCPARRGKNHQSGQRCQRWCIGRGFEGWWLFLS